MRFFIEDLDKYAYDLGLGKWAAPFMIFIFPITWPIVTYRFGNWIFNNINIPILRQLLLFIYFIFKRLTEILTCIEISHMAQIGKGLCTHHAFRCSGIIANTIIGDYNMFMGGVTVGYAGTDDHFGLPIIGNQVYFGSGSKCIGKIEIGNDVMIGANSVVVHSVPDKATVAGIPAKLLSYKGSGYYIVFKGR